MKAFQKLIVAVALLGAAANTKADAVFLLDTFNDNAALGEVRDNLGSPATSAFLGQIYGSFVSSNPADFVALGTATSFGTGGNGYLFDGTAVNVSGASPGATLNYVLKAWNSSAGSTFEAASANGSAILGVSSTASLTLANSLNAFDYQPSNGFASFQVATVPEPTTIALGVLGGLGLLARRRRNA